MTRRTKWIILSPTLLVVGYLLLLFFCYAVGDAFGSLWQVFVNGFGHGSGIWQ